MSAANSGQEAAAGFDPTKWPRRLNLGCGWDKRPDYLNVDFKEFHDPDLLADVRELHMLPDEFYEEILAQDVLEHLPREDGPVALAEWSRLLRPGGRLILRVPNILGLASVMASRPTIDEQEELARCLYGTQAYDGDYHLNGYTELRLRHHLRVAGFGEADFAPRDEWLFEVEAWKVPPRGELRVEDCVFMTTEQPSAAAQSAVRGGSREDAGDTLGRRIAAIARRRALSGAGAASRRAVRGLRRARRGWRSG